MFISSLDTAELGLWARLRSRGYRALKCLSEGTERFWLSKWYFPAILLIASAFLLANRPVGGAMTLLCLTVWLLALCPDFLACVCPFTMVFIIGGSAYIDISIFLPCAWFAVPLTMAFAVHTVMWPVTLRAGRSAYGLTMVSVATVLGGCDLLRREEFWNPVALYYSLGLGAVLLVLYILFRSQITQERSYNIYARFASIFVILGLLMAVALLSSYAWRWEEFIEAGAMLYLKYRNFAAAILLTTLPMTFYLARYSRWHLLESIVLLAAMVISGSRSALLFGAVELVLGCVYLVRCKVISRRMMYLLAAVAGVLAIAFGGKLLGVLCAGRMADGTLINGNEDRWKLLARGISDFLHHPIFGMGLGNTANSDLFVGVPGSMFFYHNLPLQVMASMGILGVAAYGRLIVDRIVLLLEGRNAFTMALAMSYMGMLMISMTNPGECCPFPNAGLMVMVFAMAELAVGDVAMPVPQLLGVRHDNRRRQELVGWAHK